MARLTAEQRLERAKRDKARAEAEIRSAAAKLREDDRRADTRRKILIGGMVIEKARKGGQWSQWLSDSIAALPEKDRAAFDGWTLPKATPAPEAPKQLPAPKQGEGNE